MPRRKSGCIFIAVSDYRFLLHTELASVAGVKVLLSGGRTDGPGLFFSSDAILMPHVPSGGTCPSAGHPRCRDRDCEFYLQHPTDRSLPSYGPVRSVVRTRPYERGDASVRRHGPIRSIVLTDKHLRFSIKIDKCLFVATFLGRME